MIQNIPMVNFRVKNTQNDRTNDIRTNGVIFCTLNRSIDNLSLIPYMIHILYESIVPFFLPRDMTYGWFGQNC